uniref:Uncharacterized protein n=1 Tax=Cannabis sativa TaxID=3483 RepID=A0ABL6V9Z9_CANSA
MAMAMVRSGLRTALRGGSRAPAQPKRNFSSSGHHDDAYETAKWEKITYVGIVGCTIFAIYNLSKGHPHYDEPPVSLLLSLYELSCCCTCHFICSYIGQLNQFFFFRFLYQWRSL